MKVKDYLQKNRVLLFDGAMGTYFAAVEHTGTQKCELANLNAPETVRKIHREYLEAGCRAVKTNTFGANLPNLEGNRELLSRVIRSGFELAKTEAEAFGAFVFADIGPLVSSGENSSSFRYKDVIDLFLSAGAENFLFETFGSGDGVFESIGYLRQKKEDAYIILSFAVQPDGFTREGCSGRALFCEAQNSEADAVGFNCVSGANHLLKFTETLEQPQKPLSVMPNAGYPTVIGNRTFFGNSPDYFARELSRIASSGATILGGCCGTTPEHIRAVAAALAETEAEIRPAFIKSTRIFEPKQTENTFWEKLESGCKVVAVELDPPADSDANAFMAGAEKLAKAGADAITVADCPIARARADSSLLSCKLKRELSVEPIPHMTCRDRNINATKALLLGLSIEKIHNVLVVTGDPIPGAQRDEVKSVFEFNSRMLARYISSLNREVLSAPFRIYAALNVNALNFDVQLSLARQKCENGVSAFFTQPVLSEEALQNLKRAKRELPAKLLGGIYPVMSYRNACFMNAEVSGIRIADEIVELYRDRDKETCRKLAVEISVKMAQKIAPYSDGFYLMTPFQNTDLICEILKKIR